MTPAASASRTTSGTESAGGGAPQLGPRGRTLAAERYSVDALS